MQRPGERPWLAHYPSGVPAERPAHGYRLVADLQGEAFRRHDGGTTGVPKGAILTQGTIIANILQSQAWNAPAMRRMAPGEQMVSVCPARDG